MDKEQALKIIRAFINCAESKCAKTIHNYVDLNRLLLLETRYSIDAQTEKDIKDLQNIVEYMKECCKECQLNPFKETT